VGYTVSRKHSSREFKLGAVGLVIRGESSAANIASDLGISVRLLYRWKRDYLADKKNAFPSSGHLKDLEDERVRALERELCSVREEQDILKK
jgi:transposase